MKTEIFLHIGFPRTATSLLQSRGCVGIFGQLKKTQYIPLKDVRKEMREIAINDFIVFDSLDVRKRIQKKFRKNRILLTCDGLTGDVFAANSNRYCILQKLALVFPEARIIVGLREQSDLVESCYKSYVAEGGTKTFGDFIFSCEEEPRRFGLCLETLRFLPYLKEVEKFFGDPFIYFFEDLDENRELFFKRFEILFGEPLKLSDKAVNRGLGAHQLGIARILNKFFKSRFNETGFSMQHISSRRIFQRDISFRLSHKPVLTEQQKQKLRDFFKDDWEAVQKMKKNIYAREGLAGNQF